MQKGTAALTSACEPRSHRIYGQTPRLHFVPLGVTREVKPSFSEVQTKLNHRFVISTGAERSGEIWPRTGSALRLWPDHSCCLP